MIRARAFLLVALAALWALPVAGQDRGQPLSPVLTLDSERLLRSTIAGQRISQDMEASFAALAAENRRIEAELEAEERDLTAQRPTMEPDAFRVLADAFDAKVQRIRSEQDTKQRQLQQNRDAEQQQLLDQVAPILSAIGNQYGAVVILERRSVILAAEGIDITDEAIARVNAIVQVPNGEEGDNGAGNSDNAGGDGQ